MKINQSIHQQLRWQNFIFTLLFLVLVGLLAWVSKRFDFQWDWTANHRHTLSQASLKVLDRLEAPVKITAFARESNEIRGPIRDLVERYQRHYPQITLEFVNPDLHPDQVRELGITVDGELRIEYGKRSELLQTFDEQSFTNALMRLAQSQDAHILFLEGHGERSPLGDANFDLGQFGHTLQTKGFKIHRWNLAKQPELPDNTTLLVIASPQVPYLPGEVHQIRTYLEKGGALLWLAEPGKTKGLEEIAQFLGIRFLPGTIVDPTGQLLGIQDPTFTLVAEYPPHAITQGFSNITLFPRATAMETMPESPLTGEAFLTTLPRSWTETGPLSGEIQFDPDGDEREGPLTLGLALTRDIESKQADKEKKTKGQRVVVIGDGDFLANAYVGNGGNLDLGVNVIQWLTHNDQFINIPAKTAPDKQLTLSSAAVYFIGFFFLLGLPFILIGTGVVIWWQRRKR